MKIVNLACTYCMVTLLSQSSATYADSSMKTATANCRNEALSTGLEAEEAITAYIDLCMQAWQNPEEYTDPEVYTEEYTDPEQYTE